MSNLMVAYKLGSSRSELSPKELITAFEFFAKDNDNKVLFTSKKFPNSGIRDRVKNLMLLSKDGNYAIKAKIDYTGVFPLLNPPKEYSLPSIFKNTESDGKDTLGWFALSNIESVIVKKGDYITLNGIDILESVSKNAYMSYIEMPQG